MMFWCVFWDVILSLTFICLRLLALLEGKGAGKNGKYQGKANKLAKRFEVVKLIRQHLGLAEQ